MTRGPAQVAAAEKAAAAVQLRAQGADYRAIAATIGCSVSTAHGIVTRTLAKLPVEDIATMRRVEGTRLEAIWSALWPAVERGNIDACATAIRVSAARCRLYGLDAPIQVGAPVEGITVVFDPALMPGRPPPVRPEMPNA